MAKAKTRWVCQECGHVAAREMGRCPKCNTWGSMVEEVQAVASTGPARMRTVLPGQVTARPTRLTDVDTSAEPRLNVPIGEFSRVLGGGIVPGSVVLISGDPGIGKSTLMLQVALAFAGGVGDVLYVSGEESVRQIKMRSARLDEAAYGANARDALYLLTETNLEATLEHVVAVKPRLLIVDSIQTMYTDEVQSTAGSVTQVRECASRLTALAKGSGLTVFLVGHVTKEGNIAGPRVLEHMVDTVLYLEGDRHHSYRLLRGVKNRFGATSEVGVFEMRQRGMVEVSNPSEAFLAERLVNAPGSSIVVTMEGTRPLLVEMQALTSPTPFGNPRRTPNGVDFNRLLLITAVLTRRAGFRLSEQDVFVNVVGGMTLEEPAADLAMAIAIASSMRDRPVPADLVAIGEVGLSGEVRSVGQLVPRLHEAHKLGFRRALVPKTARQLEGLPKTLELIPARSLRDALDVAVPKTEPVQ